MGSLASGLGVARLRWLRVLLAAVVLAALYVPAGTMAATGRIVGAETVNIRACPSTDCPVIGSASLGDEIEITGTATKGFYPVTWLGANGFVSTLYVSRDGQAPWLEETDPSCHQVAIIFNIGIGEPPSQTILNTLTAKDAAATMFPMGWWAEAEPEYLRALDAAGFPIGTHGDQMRFLTDHSDAVVRQDTLDSIAAIEGVLGRPIERIHTPYADDTDNRVRSIVAGEGLLPVGWRLSAADYADWATESAVYSRVMNGVYPGAVIEFHLDGPATETSTARALPRIIDDLRARGYELVTVPELADGCLGAPAPETGQTLRVVGTSGDGLNCRTAPTTAATRIASLAPDAKVPARGRTFSGWWPVTCSGQNGWASATYLSAEPPGGEPTPTPTPVPGGETVGTVSNTGGGGLNCRRGPATSYGVITVLAAGQTVPVRGATQGGWAPVTCAGQAGWVSAQYLTISTTGPTPAPSPSPTPAPSPTPEPPPTQPPTGDLTGKVVNTGGGGLNCRTAPWGTVITVLAAGATVPVRGATENGWVPVTCGGRDGWVSAEYLSIAGGSTGQISGVVTTGGARANCRTAPWGTVITSLANGTEVVVRGGSSDGWVPIRCANQDGWIHGDLIRLR